MSNANQECYTVECEPEGRVRPPLRIIEISNTRKCLNMKYMEGNNVQRVVSVIGDENNDVVEKHVTYKSPWNMPRLGHGYDRDGVASF
jgi:hypothetical protein